MAASVLLPLPLGPITAWTSPSFMVRSIPLRIFLSSTPAVKFLISKIGFIRLTNTAFQTYSEKFLSFHRELHRKLAEHFFAKAVHDHIHCVLRGKSALVAIKNLVLANF